MANKWTDPPIQIILSIAIGFPAFVLAHIFVAYTFGVLYTTIIPLSAYAYYQYVFLSTPPADTEAFLSFKDEVLKKRWGSRKIPMHILVEAFLDGQVAFNGDVLETLDKHRDEFIDWRPNWSLFVFLVQQALPATSSSFKNVKATTKEIADHYDRGDDFFAAFLGPMMIYTSAYFNGTDQTLEQAQENKLNLICEKLHLKPGHTMLDIGCGWGTLVRHAASRFGARSTGVTLSKEGARWCREQNEAANLSCEQCDIMHCDYREIPVGKRFNAISAVEMAEHVGIANFQLFLGNVRDMLEDDGLFFMQVAGLRKGSNWQDTQWGLFMSRYIFPGADASTPLYWYTQQCEMAGFEVHSVENIGRHYSHTLKAWYFNFLANRSKEQVRAYPERLCRLW
eukprot:CAMPEP_0119298766 /NCGR_PEP_ID=MMETSP1333-20130426/920_1 /TAXON_ID=418940 /ORGANISM="Scyphosphaera apsteinii, Strain RCC1455" /LENGTH=394 /DNA_ID=CAMNT_0007299959 /DNA_START=110 /DNA_END=1291 /DNA_ORIENTATION=-